MPCNCYEAWHASCDDIQEGRIRASLAVRIVSWQLTCTSRIVSWFPSYPVSAPFVQFWSSAHAKRQNNVPNAAGGRVKTLQQKTCGTHVSRNAHAMDTAATLVVSQTVNAAPSTRPHLQKHGLPTLEVCASCVRPQPFHPLRPLLCAPHKEGLAQRTCQSTAHDEGGKLPKPRPTCSSTAAYAKCTPCTLQ
eukprot:6183123-Pleurochrysis_carterae.AAC.1